MLIEPHSRLVMIGDSVTDAEHTPDSVEPLLNQKSPTFSHRVQHIRSEIRTRYAQYRGSLTPLQTRSTAPADVATALPEGEGWSDAVGRGYVSYVDALLRVSYPTHAIRVTNKGKNGNTVKHLAARWQRDVLDLKPDWLSIMIGVNDVWRQFIMPDHPDAHVYPEEYEAVLTDLVEQTYPLLKGLVLMTPFYVESRTDDPMRQRMDQYGDIVKRTALKYNVLYVDTQAAFNELLVNAPAGTLAPDRVHPSHIGHMALARAFLNAIGFEWRVS